MKKVLMFFLLLTGLYAKSEINVGLEKMKGSTSYTIWGEDEGGWKSLLEFPLEYDLLNLEYVYRADKFNLHLNYKQNLEKGTGTFEDSDWIYSTKNSVALYSQSDIISDYKSFSTEISRTKKLKDSDSSIKYGIGYKEQEIEFNAYGYNYPNSNSIGYEKSLEYSVKYMIPYVKLEFLSNENDKISFKTNLQFSPKIKGKDVDNHILRNKLSTSSSQEGYSYEISEETTYNFSKDLALSFKGSYSFLKTEGKQKQEFYSGEFMGEVYEGIKNELKKEEYSMEIRIRKIVK